MKKTAVCSVCAEDFQQKCREKTGINMGSVPGYCSVEYIVNEENFYELTCTAGHQFVVIHNEEKFDLLFKGAVSAFEAGYFREAVSSVAVSIERFHEYLIRVMCLSQGLADKDIDETWNSVKSQSERQLGSYIFLYLIVLKQKPIKINNKKTEFRNNVIHKGVFPSEEETLNYLEYALNYYYDTLNIFKKSYSRYLVIPYDNRYEDFKMKYAGSNLKIELYFTSHFEHFIKNDQRYPISDLIVTANAQRFVLENRERKIRYYDID